jgi:hypothetical protein
VNAHTIAPHCLIELDHILELFRPSSLNAKWLHRSPNCCVGTSCPVPTQWAARRKVRPTCLTINCPMLKPRKPFGREVRRPRHLSAWMKLQDRAVAECHVMDISKNGAKIALAASSVVRDQFQLTSSKVTKRGPAKLFCLTARFWASSFSAIPIRNSPRIGILAFQQMDRHIKSVWDVALTSVSLFISSLELYRRAFENEHLDLLRFHQGIRYRRLQLLFAVWPGHHPIPADQIPPPDALLSEAITQRGRRVPTGTIREGLAQRGAGQ